MFLSVQLKHSLQHNAVGEFDLFYELFVACRTLLVECLCQFINIASKTVCVNLSILQVRLMSCTQFVVSSTFVSVLFMGVATASQENEINDCERVEKLGWARHMLEVSCPTREKNHKRAQRKTIGPHNDLTLHALRFHPCKIQYYFLVSRFLPSVTMVLTRGQMGMTHRICC